MMITLHHHQFLPAIRSCLTRSKTPTSRRSAGCGLRRQVDSCLPGRGARCHGRRGRSLHPPSTQLRYHHTLSGLSPYRRAQCPARRRRQPFARHGMPNSPGNEPAMQRPRPISSGSCLIRPCQPGISIWPGSRLAWKRSDAKRVLGGSARTEQYVQCVSKTEVFETARFDQYSRRGFVAFQK